MPAPFLRIGTRGSPLALWQAEATRQALAARHTVDADLIEIIVIRTTGDVVRDRPLADVGGKGLFTKELEEALVDGRVDLAVHSAKDVPTFLPDGLDIVAFLPRADARDVLIAPIHRTLDALPQGALVGTASVRRAALLRHRRPDLRTTLLRGNVETRLRKAAEGEVDATLLALAGLRRLGLDGQATEIFDPDVFLPAVGQGAVAIEVSLANTRARELVRAIDDADTAIAVSAERALLAVLDGSCRTPIAGHATISGDSLHLDALVIAPDGSAIWETSRTGPVAEAVALGTDAGRDLLARVPQGIIITGGQ
jgi:hydroxymethylbilane synthase